MRAFVRHNAGLRDLPGMPGLRLHAGGDIMSLLDLSATVTGLDDPPLPYWAYAWSGGLALAHHILERPDVVRGRRVLDVAAGSGLCAIMAMRQGALAATAVDVDPLAGVAIGLNARANAVAVDVVTGDLGDLAPSGWDVVLAGDVCYEEDMAGQLIDWLRRASRAGSTVLIGDPGRRYLPGGLVEVAAYTVQASLDVEEAEFKRARIFAVRD